MSDTPRTDAQCYGDGRHPYVPTEFARQLERELAEARQSLEFQMQLNREVIEREKQTHSELCAERALADRMANTLEDIAFGTIIRRASGGCGQMQLWTAPQMASHAEQAIDAWKEARRGA